MIVFAIGIEFPLTVPMDRLHHSTRPVAQIVMHAGIVATTAYELREPTIPPDPAMRIAP